MKRMFKNLKIQEEFSHVLYLHYGIITLIAMTLAYKLYATGSPFFVALQMIVYIVFFKMLDKTLKNQFYTFWTFQLVFGLIIIWSLFRNIYIGEHQFLIYAYLSVILLMLIESHILSSPIYYPRVAWWEYDFRYRGDLKIKINKDQNMYNGRLTDLRREAGCVVLFEDLEIGSVVILKSNKFDTATEFEIEIMCKREPLIGRGFTYGVKFILKSPEEKQAFKNFMIYWKQIKKIKKRLKFNKV